MQIELAENNLTSQCTHTGKYPDLGMLSYSVQFLKCRVTFNSFMSISTEDVSSYNLSICLRIQLGEAKRKCLLVFVSNTK